MYVLRGILVLSFHFTVPEQVAESCAHRQVEGGCQMSDARGRRAHKGGKGCLAIRVAGGGGAEVVSSLGNFVQLLHVVSLFSLEENGGRRTLRAWRPGRRSHRLCWFLLGQADSKVSARPSHRLGTRLRVCNVMSCLSEPCESDVPPLAFNIRLQHGPAVISCLCAEERDVDLKS